MRKLFAAGLPGILAAGLLAGSTAAPYATASVDPGPRWGELVILDDDQRDVYAVDLATSANANTVASWASYGGSRPGNFFAVHPRGGSWGPPEQILPGDFTTFVTHGSKVSVASTHDGEFLLRTLRADATWGPTRTVEQVPVHRYASYHLTGNDAGDLTVWWTRTNGLNRLIVRRDGEWQQKQRIPIGRGVVEGLSMDDSGIVDVVYTPKRTEVASPSIKHIRRVPPGLWGPPTTLAEGSIIAISVAENDAGALAVSWEEKYPDRYAWSLRLRYRSADGGWLETFVLAERTPEQEVAGLSISDNGRLAVAWRHLQDGETLRFASRGPQGRWTPAQVVADSREIGAWYGDLAGNGTGETVLPIGIVDQDRGVEVIRCRGSGTAERRRRCLKSATTTRPPSWARSARPSCSGTPAVGASRATPRRSATSTGAADQRL